MPFLALQSFLSMCFLKLCLSSSISPRCFFGDALRRMLLLSTRSGWSITLDFLEKRTSVACFKGSGLKDISQWKARLLIRLKSLLSSLEDLVG